jgi:hypothetical protein
VRKPEKPESAKTAAVLSCGRFDFSGSPANGQSKRSKADVHFAIQKMILNWRMMRPMMPSIARLSLLW